MNELSERERFFYDAGAWSYDMRTETSDQGKIRCAKESAESEIWAEVTGIVFEWSEDWTVGNHAEEFSVDAYPNGNPDTCEVVCAYDATGRFLASLGCVDDADDAYRRVVQAELAGEAYANQSETRSS